MTGALVNFPTFVQHVVTGRVHVRGCCSLRHTHQGKLCVVGLSQTLESTWCWCIRIRLPAWAIPHVCQPNSAPENTGFVSLTKGHICK